MIYRILYFISITVIFIFWWIFNKIVENQDLYSEKDDLKKTKNSYFLIKKILYFISISVKCIFWQIFKEIVENKDL